MRPVSPRTVPPLCRRICRTGEPSLLGSTGPGGADGGSAVAGTLREAWALSCDDESLFDNVMVIIRWRVERGRAPGRSLDRNGQGQRTACALTMRAQERDHTDHGGSTTVARMDARRHRRSRQGKGPQQMAGLELDGSNPDVSVLYDINGLAKAAPTWLDRVMEFVGEYGIHARPRAGGSLVLVEHAQARERRGFGGHRRRARLGAARRRPRGRWSTSRIRGFVERPRPFSDHEGLEVLVQRQDGLLVRQRPRHPRHGPRRRHLRGQPEVRLRRDRPRASSRASAASTWASTTPPT